LTRKDYIILAEALRVQFHRSNLEIANSEGIWKTNAQGIQAGVLNAAYEIADSLKQDNSSFNREHFLAVVRGEKDLHSRPSSKPTRKESRFCHYCHVCIDEYGPDENSCANCDRKNGVQS
jgi:hypothetical protein